MRYRYLIGAGVALAAMLSWADARAQMLSAPSGPAVWYFGGEGGWTSLNNQTTSISGVGSATQTWNDGFNAGARVGLEWGPWRFEEEFSFRQNGTTALGSIPIRGQQDAYAFMTNAIYDFRVGGWPLTPHLGGGIGVVGLRDGARLTVCCNNSELFYSTDWEFGYQAIAGIRYNISPALAFDLDYRYLGTVDAKYRTSPAGIPAPIGAPGNATVKSGYDSHSIVASLSWRFGAPPPPAVAAPMPPAMAPMGRRVFLVFFDWDRDTITPDGMAILQQAADAFRSGAPVTIQVTGYTDRSGSPGYNQRLSERRAHNVANALSRMGVARSQMAVSGRGENDNRVPTADGVREPQNRRVEIVFP